MSSTLTPTGEQTEIIDNIRSGENLKIEAAAGSGKTSTLRMACEVTDGDILYLAYNKEAQTAAERSFPKNVECQPDGTMVRIPVRAGKGYTHTEVPIESLTVGDLVVSVTSNGTGGGSRIRKSGQRIAGILRHHHEGQLITVTSDGLVSSYTPEHPCVVRVGDAFKGKHLVYLMRRNDRYKVGYLKWDGADPKRNGLLARIHQEQPDALWVLEVLDSREEGLVEERIIQHQWNLPGFAFRDAKKRDLDNGGPLDKFWCRVQANKDKAITCLESYGLDIDFPFWSRGQSTRFMWSAYVMAACNLRDGMRMVAADNALPTQKKGARGGTYTEWRTPYDVWTPITVRRKHYEGQVTSIEVEEDHTYIADGIVTHNCRTLHSLGWHGTHHSGEKLGAAYGARLGKRVPAWETANLMGVQHDRLDLGGSITLDGTTIARLASETVDRFCHDSTLLPQPQHVPVYDGFTEDQIDYLRAEIVPYARKLWKQTQNVSSAHRFTPDMYLKLWSLGNTFLAYDTILLDEAQDSNNLAKKIVTSQSAQLVAVGDRCQPTGTEVTVVVEPPRRVGQEWTLPVTKQIRIEDLREGDKVISYDIAKRYIHRAGSAITGITRRPYTGPLVEVATTTHADGDTRRSRYTPNHHCVVRISGAFDDKYVVYMMKKGDNYRLGTTTGRLTSQNKKLGVVQRTIAEKADCAWVVSVHATKAEALAQEALLAWKYQVPDMMFRSVNHGMGQDGLDAFWAELGNNRDRAAALLADNGRDIDHPLTTKSEPLQTRRPEVIRACNLFDGMEVLPLLDHMTEDGHSLRRSDWTPITVTTNHYDGDVWSMDVENDHTYAGDGIFTHNCQQLYAWRGARNILDEWPADTTLRLTKSFRFGQAIADEANTWLPLAGADYQITGNEAMDSRVVTRFKGANPTAVLCRTNATAMGRAMDYLAKDVKVAMAGGVGQLEALVKAADDLKNGKRTSHPDLMAFKNWGELMSYTHEPQGKDLGVLVALVEKYGTSTLIQACKRMVTPAKAELTVSTGHKAKGLEWDHVEIAEDFREPAPIEDPRTGKEKPGPVHKTEAMLAYVAVTRGRHILDNNGLAWIHDRATTTLEHKARQNALKR